MDCSSLHRHQETMASHNQSLDSMLMCTKPENGSQQLQQEKKPRPADEQAMKCPRCDSTNTKFCYYNNYSLTQPRYFCKSCRRYWTKGGTLRNVPVGGGCRRNKRSSSLSKRSTGGPDCHPDLMIAAPTSSSSQSLLSPLCSYDQTLALAQGNLSILGNHGNGHFDLFGNPNGNNSFLDTLRSSLIENNNNNNNNHHFLYYGHGGSGNFGDVVPNNNGGGTNNNNVDVNHEDHRHEIAMHFVNHSNNRDIMSNPSSGSSTPEIKHEFSGENRILWGLPWQLNGERNYMMNGGNNESDSLKESWNNAIVGSTWNNLLNSPLM